MTTHPHGDWAKREAVEDLLLEINKLKAAEAKAQRAEELNGKLLYSMTELRTEKQQLRSQVDAQKTIISDLEQIKKETARAYNELIAAVGNEYPGETRHDAVLRQLRQSELTAAFGLLPKPCCNTAPDIKVDSRYCGPSSTTIRCGRCGRSTGTVLKNFQAVVEEWNTMIDALSSRESK
jgi:hypothetical protein